MLFERRFFMKRKIRNELNQKKENYLMWKSNFISELQDSIDKGYEAGINMTPENWKKYKKFIRTCRFYNER